MLFLYGATEFGVNTLNCSNNLRYIVMFEIETLSRSDFSFAINLTNAMNWHMAKADFEFALKLEPNGCFLLKDGTRRLGIATCLSYGKVGWFGNLIVEPSSRRKGAGSALVSHAIQYLLGRGVETVGLYAYHHLVDFYGKLGFKADCNFSLMHIEKLPKIPAKTLLAIGKKEFPQVAEFDEKCFGGDRTRLLRSIIEDKDNFSCVLFEDKSVVGYVAATIAADTVWVGPLVCQQSRIDDTGFLVQSVLACVHGKGIYVVVSEKEHVLFDIFSGLGFAKEFSVSRMFLGKAAAQDCVYIAESLERG